MSKAGVTYSEVKEVLFNDKEFQLEYEKLKHQYEIISQTIAAEEKIQDGKVLDVK